MNDIKLGTFNNDTILSHISEKIMVTKGEWDLQNMEIIDNSLSKGGSGLTYLVYRVRKCL